MFKKKIKKEIIELKCLFCGGETNKEKNIYEKYVKLSQHNLKKELIPKLICPHCNTVNRLVIKSQSDKAVKKKNIFTKGLNLLRLFIVTPIEKVLDLIAFILAKLIGAVIKYKWIEFFNTLAQNIFELIVFGYIYYLNPILEMGIFILIYFAIQKRCLVVNIGAR